MLALFVGRRYGLDFRGSFRDFNRRLNPIPSMRTLTFFLAALCLCSVVQANPFRRFINGFTQYLNFNKQFPPKQPSTKSFSTGINKKPFQFSKEPQSPQEWQAIKNQWLIGSFPSDFDRGFDIEVDEEEPQAEELEPQTAAELERYLDLRHMRHLQALWAENNQIFGANRLQTGELDGQLLGGLQGPSEMHAWLWKGF